MYLLCVILITIAAVLMCLIVLIQNSKGGGLASGFASSNQIMGVKKTTDFIEKATWSLAAFMVVVCIVATYAIPQATVAEESLIQQSVIGLDVRIIIARKLTVELHDFFQCRSKGSEIIVGLGLLPDTLCFIQQQ